MRCSKLVGHAARWARSRDYRETSAKVARFSRSPRGHVVTNGCCGPRYRPEAKRMTLLNNNDTYRFCKAVGGHPACCQPGLLWESVARWCRFVLRREKPPFGRAGVVDPTSNRRTVISLAGVRGCAVAVGPSAIARARSLRGKRLLAYWRLAAVRGTRWAIVVVCHEGCGRGSPDAREFSSLGQDGEQQATENDRDEQRDPEAEFAKEPA